MGFGRWAHLGEIKSEPFTSRDTGNTGLAFNNIPRLARTQDGEPDLVIELKINTRLDDDKSALGGNVLQLSLQGQLRADADLDRDLVVNTFFMALFIETHLVFPSLIVLTRGMPLSPEGI